MRFTSQFVENCGKLNSAKIVAKHKHEDIVYLLFISDFIYL